MRKKFPTITATLSATCQKKGLALSDPARRLQLAQHEIATHRAAEPAGRLTWLIHVLRHALPAGEEIADKPEHGAEIDRHQPGLVLEDHILAGDEAGAHAADRLAVEAHGLAAYRRGGGIAHQPHDGRRPRRTERIAKRKRRQHAESDGRRRKLPGAQDARSEPEQQRRDEQKQFAEELAP